MRLRRPARPTLAALAIALLAAAGAPAQDASAVVVVDQERLFLDSRLGQSITEELEARSAALATENRAIEAELIAEERRLTEQRPDLDPAEFRELADAFDARVDRLRSEQDAKTRELVSLRDAERQRFTQLVGPILLEFMRDSGASVMLDRRSVVATAERVDVTEELIDEIDARVAAAEGPNATEAGEPAAEAEPAEADNPAATDDPAASD